MTDAHIANSLALVEEALRDLRVLDSAPQAEFDDLAKLAAMICQVPIALVSLIGSGRSISISTDPVTTRCSLPMKCRCCGRCVANMSAMRKS